MFYQFVNQVNAAIAPRMATVILAQPLFVAYPDLERCVQQRNIDLGNESADDCSKTSDSSSEDVLDDDKQ